MSNSPVTERVRRDGTEYNTTTYVDAKPAETAGKTNLRKASFFLFGSVDVLAENCIIALSLQRKPHSRNASCRCVCFSVSLLLATS
jgi:hypothetical protein